MSDEAKKQKCEVPGCKGDSTWCYHGGSSHELCDDHDHALDLYYHCLAVRDESHEADDRAEATLAAIHAGDIAYSVEDYVTARKRARVKEAVVDKYIQTWIKDQGAAEG